MWISRLWLATLIGLLIVQVWSPFVGPTQVNDSYSVENSGRRAIYDLASERYGYVERNHRPFARFVRDHAASGSIVPDVALCLLGPARYPSASEWKVLLDWIHQGGRLLIAADMTGDNTGFEIPDLKVKVELPERKFSTKPQLASTVTTRLLASPVKLQWRSQATLTAPADAVVLVQANEKPQAVRVAHGQGWIVVVASDYVFSNESLDLADADNVALAYRLLQLVGGSPEREIAFDEYLNGAAKPTIESLLLDDALRPLTTQFSVLLLIYAWLGTRRFGGLLPTSTPPRRDIADHTNALGNLYYKRNNAGGVVAMYLNQLRMELKLKAGGKLDATVLERLARRTGEEIDHIRQILQGAETAANSPMLSRREAARIIRQLAELRQKALVSRTS